MTFSPARAFVFAIIGLPLGFVLTALCLVITDQPVSASGIFPWALALAGVAGVAGGFWRARS